MYFEFFYKSGQQGRDYMEIYGISTLSSDHFHNYDPSVDGAVSNEFASAAFYMGETQIYSDL